MARPAAGLRRQAERLLHRARIDFDRLARPLRAGRHRFAFIRPTPTCSTICLAPTGHSCGKRVVVITDSLSVNAIWYRCSADYFLLPNERSAAVLHEAGIAPATHADVWLSGQPGVFGERRRCASRHPTPRGATCFTSRTRANRPLPSLPSGLPRSTASISRSRSAAIARLRKAIDDVRQLPSARSSSSAGAKNCRACSRRTHLLISKAGGATVQEAIAAGCPMIVNHVIPGQEEGNARFLVETNSGTIATTQARPSSPRSKTPSRMTQQIWREWAA